MSLKIVLTFLLFSTVTFADELKVSIRDADFSLKYSKKDIQLTGRNYKLSLKRKKCNLEIINSFYKTLTETLQLKDIKTCKENTFFYDINNIRNSACYQSYVGRMILNIPNEIYRMKFEEKYACK